METRTLEAIDGERVRAFVARPEGEPRGCVVVVQEIFGVNDHVRWVLAEQYAAAGWLAVAPAFFDRLEPDAELPYTPEGTARARELVGRLGMDAPLRDIRAAQLQVGEGLPTGVVGYCWGGTVALLAATRLGLPAVGYYGGRTLPFLHERPQAPAMLHFGERDALIPMDAVRRISTALPDVACHVYPAGHGFNRHGHPDWHADSAATALARTHGFLTQHLHD
ncbi:MAG TPA: dienelactone hydrolase family protein [Burkholderiaceae bacterium]|nr:dienelactone hydrolase family protein [Burkholderiaceae bacterium]